MIKQIVHDGDAFDLENNEWDFSERDLKKFINSDNYGIDFVGFVTNENNDLLVSFPKKYFINNINSNVVELFNVILKHIQINPDKYIGEQLHYSSNFPFAYFFEIYNYYLEYGLYTETFKKYDSSNGKKINWKYTLKHTKFYIENDRLVMMPFYFEKNIYEHEFIASCMKTAINYSIEKFGLLFNYSSIENGEYELDYIENSSYIVEQLYLIKQNIFIDKIDFLINNLICFFENIKLGGKYYLKHYNFQMIWEDMLLEFLNRRFDGIENNKLKFIDKNESDYKFKKQAFYPNKAKKNSFIEVDYYCEKDSIQYIFDAKYKENYSGMDYKQIAYFLFLKEYNNRYNKTYSTLLMPDEKYHTEKHFEMEENFSISNNDIYITEEYLNINDIIKFYNEIK